jgi:hypothetical protein
MSPYEFSLGETAGRNRANLGFRNILELHVISMQNVKNARIAFIHAALKNRALSGDSLATQTASVSPPKHSRKLGESLPGSGATGAKARQR